MVENRTFVGIYVGESNHSRVSEGRCEMDFVHPQYVALVAFRYLDPKELYTHKKDKEFTNHMLGCYNPSLRNMLRVQVGSP